MDLYEKGRVCKEASYNLMTTSTERKNDALESIAKSLEDNMQDILKANEEDIRIAKENNTNAGLIDRLALNEDRMKGIIDGVRQVINLEDPCFKVLKEWDRGELHIIKRSVPIGVIGIIFEARPNVCVDATALCLKSGNACFLRGSKNTINSNKALVKAMRQGLININFNEDCIQLVEDTSHEEANRFMKMNKYLDLLIPRGGAGLIRNAVQNATVPIIETGTGNCHVYVDEYADINKAIPIIINAKTQRISVCNACESLLIHEDVVEQFLPKIVSALKEYNVKMHAEDKIMQYDKDFILATDEDYGTEYLDYEISIKTVKSVYEAIDHINKYSTKHSEVIVSENQDNINAFLGGVDSACVYANASSRFSDGNEFGFGAEIGISTQKIHARGPMGLEALTSYKYQITGNGTIRK